jgi:hypothetical protein
VDEQTAGEVDPCHQSVGPKRIKEVRKQLHAMHKAAQPLLTDNVRKAYWTSAWELAVVNAATLVESNKKKFYRLRLVALTSAIIVPSLVGLNLSGTGGVAVRWVTFALSLVVALTTAILTLFRFGDRWFMYRELNNDLMSAGWALLNGAGKNPDAAWTAFITTTETARAKYNSAYETEVIAAVQPKVDDQEHIDKSTT